MKAPKYCIVTLQQAIDLGLNGFALVLMAESFADAPAKFDHENVAFLAHAHNGQEVWFIMSKSRPRLEDFDGTPLPKYPKTLYVVPTAKGWEGFDDFKDEWPRNAVYVLQEVYENVPVTDKRYEEQGGKIPTPDERTTHPDEQPTSIQKQEGE